MFVLVYEIFISSHGNKNTLSPFYDKIILIENECKTPVECLNLFSIKYSFYDKMDLRPFYFRVTISHLANYLTPGVH